jgi:cold shock protein
MFDRRPNFFRADDERGAARQVDATVKWFNASKGFGFVALDDGTPDAFLPMAAVRRAGYDDVREGASIRCEIGAGAKGPLVVSVLNIDNSTVAPHPAPRANRGEGGSAARPAQTLEGAVKWFEPERGFGFIAPDGGGKDIFVHVTTLHRSGVEVLGPGQRVRVAVVDGRKGLEADRVTLI